MADIGMCGDINCPLRRKCYRFTSPKSMYQYYMNTNRKEGDDKCDYFLNNDGYDMDSSLTANRKKKNMV